MTTYKLPDGTECGPAAIPGLAKPDFYVWVEHPKLGSISIDSALVDEVKPPLPPQPPKRTVVLDRDGDAWQHTGNGDLPWRGAHVGECDWESLNLTHGPLTRLVPDPADDAPALLREIERLTAKIEDRRMRLVDAESDLLDVRGILAPAGYPDVTPLPLVPTVAPAVQWLVDRLAAVEQDRDRLQAELTATRNNRLISAVFGHHKGAPRPFALYRTGEVRETGLIALGAEFPDGAVALRLANDGGWTTRSEGGAEGITGYATVVWLSDELESLAEMEQDRDKLSERLAAAETVATIFGWTGIGEEGKREKATVQAYMDWANRYGAPKPTPEWRARVAELAARRDAIRAKTLAAIRGEHSGEAGQ